MLDFDPETLWELGGVLNLHGIDWVQELDDLDGTGAGSGSRLSASSS